MPEKKILRVLWKLFLAALIIAGAWLFFRWVLPWVLPFCIALLIAKLLEPAVRLLTEKMKLPRALASAVVTLLAAGAILALLFWGLSRFIFEARIWMGKLPALISQMPDMATGLRSRLDTLIAAAPVEMQEFLRSSFEKMLEGGVTVPETVYRTLANWLAATAGALPSVMLFTVAMTLSTYFISSDYPRVVRAILRQIPRNWQEKAMQMYHHMMGTIGKWLKAQGTMVLLTLGEAFLGLTILRVPQALLLAVLIALVDALPVLGAGLTLLPWAAYCLLTGDTVRGVGLAILYGVISLARGFLEPKLVGHQIGLHPLATLVAMYVGFQITGLAGMILFPILAITVKQLQDWGYVKLWK